MNTESPSKMCINAVISVSYLAKSVSNRNICFDKAVLHSKNIELSTHFCVAWHNLPPPPILNMNRDLIKKFAPTLFYPFLTWNVELERGYGGAFTGGSLELDWRGGQCKSVFRPFR